MSKVLGIIAEYNPFHNGHLYHIRESVEQTEADYVVCVISGNFVQRGNTSIIDKWTKAKMAIAQGADLVIELPTIYATSSAENFAEGAIKILDSLGIVDTLSFGIEAKDLATLNNIANVLYQEPKEYVTMLNHELNKGVSFPKARENALMMYLNDIKRYVVLEPHIDDFELGCLPLILKNSKPRFDSVGKLSDVNLHSHSSRFPLSSTNSQSHLFP